ncbi:MAG TPA: ribosome assembly RNA-binding protein YhbY [Candidatus Hydrogenedentes bacterium]|mgnify:CR=1 FL=1|nr:ribosome assembly RNA-binding protein YhbY [Candidatus Hydrogenedentota bacterium]HOS04359.1 ribosome assembly RNA-binding protein YhbY [Candidatus Hydrogenedentota bacterium]
MQLTGAQRKYLRGLAHSLQPMVLVGKQGVSDSLIEAASQALGAHELIKVKFNDFKDEREELAQRIEEGTGAHIVGIIGNIVILYRQNEDEADRRITLPGG